MQDRDTTENAGAVPDVDPAGARARLEAGALAVDVREDAEWATGHVAGSRHQRLADLDPDALPRDRPLVAVCRSGRRSREAAEQLVGAGHDVVNLAGGLQAWADAGHPLVTESGAPGAVG